MDDFSLVLVAKVDTLVDRHQCGYDSFVLYFYDRP